MSFSEGSVIPYLETNRLRPRVPAIQKARPLAYRAKVLGRALLATHTNSNSFWMLLSRNLEAAFPPTTATTVAADVNLSITPTTNAHVATAAASGGTSATNFATLTIGQKPAHS
jgi:hypothetical protein